MALIHNIIADHIHRSIIRDTEDILSLRMVASHAAIRHHRWELIIFPDRILINWIGQDIIKIPIDTPDLFEQITKKFAQKDIIIVI